MFLTYLTLTLFNSAVKPCVVLPQTQRQLAQNHLIKGCVRKRPQNRFVLLLPQSRMYFDRLCCASNYIVKRFCDVSARGRLLRRSRILPGPVFGKQRGKKTWHSCLYLMAHHLVLWFSWLNSATTCSNYTRNLKSTVETCWNQERSLKLWIIWFDGAQVLIKITLESRHSWLSVALFKASLQTFPHPQTHRSKTDRTKWCPAASSVVHWCKILPGIGLS